MENTISLNSHEALELHELIRNKVTELKKTQSSLPMVQDSDLQAYMNDMPPPIVKTRILKFKLSPFHFKLIEFS